MARLGLIDYGSGNVGSVRNALGHLGIPFLDIRHPGDLDQASHLLLPGVGSFPNAMARLRDLRLDDALQHQLATGSKPFLGICVGMQILATLGTEFSPTHGLDLIPGSVQRLDLDSPGLRLPHVGWNQVSARPSHPLFAGIDGPPDFYFVHSFAFAPLDPSHIAATCTYGIPFVAAVQRGGIFGVQFHPEKSQHTGLQLLRNFWALS